GQQFTGKGVEVCDGEYQNADDNNDEQKARSASRMQCRKLLRIFDGQRLAGLEVVNGLVLGAVVLKNTVHILHQRHDVQEGNENENPKSAVDTVKQQRTLKSDLGLNQPRNHQRKSDKDEDVDSEGNDETASDHPGRNLSRIALAVLLDGFFGKRFFSRKTQGA